MKSFEDAIPIIFAIVVAVVLFLGIVTALTKSLKAPPQRDTIDSTFQRLEQKRRIEDVRRRQKQLMQDQKQKIRDLQRR